MAEEMTAPSGFTRRVMPAYLVLDTSGSMAEYEALLNKTLASIYETLYRSPQVSEFVHLSVVSFDTEPYVVVPMMDIESLNGLPTVQCGGLTNYGPMFRMMRERIDEDLAAFRSQGYQVVRPVIFLLTDGIPSDDDWEKDFADLRDDSWKPRPHTITYGFGEASEQVLLQVSTAAAYLAEEGSQADTAKALTGALTSMLNSLVTSAATRRLEIPTSVEGYRPLSLEDID